MGRAPHALDRRRLPPSVTLASQVRAALGAVVVLLLAILAAAFYVPYELNASSNEKYVHDVIPLRGLVQDLVLQMATEHASVEAYLATGDRRTLNRYLRGSAAANRDLAAMQPYLRRHPEIDRLVQEAVPEISDLEGQFAQQIAFAESG